MNVVMGLTFKLTCFVILAAACAAGCGGGGSAPASGSTAASTSKIGEATVTYFGQPKPQLTSSSGYVSVVGQAGATFSSVVLQPAPNLDSTYLTVGREYSNEEGIYKVAYPSGTSQLLYQNDNQAYGPATSAYGAVAFYDSTVNSIKTIRPDGTGLTTLSLPGVTGANWPAYANDGTNRLAFTAGLKLYVAPGTGGTPTAIQTNDLGLGQAWSPSGNQIMYTALVENGTAADLFVTPAGGGTPQDVTPTPLKGVSALIDPAWSPDGVTIVAMEQAGSPEDGYALIKFNINVPGSYTTLTTANADEVSPAFSPDGSLLALYRYDDSSETPGIYLEDALGANSYLLDGDTTDEANVGFGGLSWSPFLPKETVVAASGSTFFHKAASGFLLSENGDQFGSFVAFTATTPSTAAIEAPSASTSRTPLIFTVTADAITSFGYINDYFSPGTTLTLTSTPSVVVSIDGQTGQVDTVAPALAKPSVTKNADGTVTYRGNFKAVYDSKGKNLAPTGATQLTVDPSTGKVSSFK